MPKEHVVKLTVSNKTKFELVFKSEWFDSGRVADGWEIPKLIAPGEEKIVECYERDNALAGCSGYIDYSLNGGLVTIAFSNPSVGRNKVGCGLAEGEGGKNVVWNTMGYHDYQPVTEQFKIGDILFVVKEICTGGSVNKADVVFLM